MKTNHTKADLYMADREKGLTYQEIAEKYGVSYQAVSKCCGKYHPGHMKPFTETEVVYPYLRKWLNENKVCRSEFARRMGYAYGSRVASTLSSYFRGRENPPKNTIDKMIEVTGLPYEKLFARDEHGTNATTNAGHIKAMSEEALAADRVHRHVYTNYELWCGDFYGVEYTKEAAIERELEWLKQPYKEDA